MGTLVCSSLVIAPAGPAALTMMSCISPTEVTVRNGFTIPVTYDIAYVIETFGELATIEPAVGPRGPLQPGELHSGRLLFSGPESAPLFLVFTVRDTSATELSTSEFAWAEVRRAGHDLTLVPNID